MSVVIPTTQRSWIGKAHLIPPSIYPLPSQKSVSGPQNPNEALSDLVTPTYYIPSTDSISAILPQGDLDYWVLVPGTPATCTQLGIFHYAQLFPNRPSSQEPVDLVLSGPNHGRNTTAAFALSSGTLGGALEGAVCGVRAIALSFAFFTRQEGPELIEAACIHSIKIVNKLCSHWDGQMQTGEGQGIRPDVYTINVPLVEGVADKPVRWTWMLDNKWRDGSLYKVMDHGTTAEEKGSRPSFKWGPSFTDVWKTVEESPMGNDGQTIREGCTSVTPLKANYEGLYGKGGFLGDLKL